MDGENSDAPAGIRARVRPILRLGIAALLLGPGVSKFLTYGRSVQFFETLELPVPAVLVLVVGTIEIGVAVFLFLDRAPRSAAATAVPVMIVAGVTAGPTWQNLGVLISAFVLIAIDTEPEGLVNTERTT
jgi:uncharacterized membrane protein YphA (DoxX/SURF4 family)